MKTPLRFALVAVFLLLGGCGAELSLRSPGDNEPEDWSLIEDLRIGSVNDPDQALTRVMWGVLPIPDGRLWIHQVEDNQFRAYGINGEYLGPVGKEGQGPGEFIGLGEFGWWGSGRDTIWVVSLNRRVSLFDIDGEFVRSFPWVVAAHLDGFAVQRPYVLLSDGSALGRANHDELNDFRIIRYDPVNGTVQQELARLARHDITRFKIGNPPINGSTPLPIPDQELVAFAPGGRWFVVVDRAAVGMPDVGHLPLHAIGLDGDTLWSRTYPYVPLEISQVERDSIIEARLSGFREVRRSSMGRLATVSDADLEQGVIDTYTLPGHRPSVRTALIDQDERVWLEWTAPEGQTPEWWALDRLGNPLARIRPSRRIDVRAAAGDLLWGVETDALDVPYVVRYRIQKAAAPNQPGRGN